MKKRKVILVVIAILLIAVVFTSGCSNTQKIEEALEGTWYSEGFTGFVAYRNHFTFTNNRSYVCYKETYVPYNGNTNERTYRGTYEIIDNEIILTNTDGEIFTVIRYTYEDEYLQLIDVDTNREGADTLTKEE